MNKWLKIILIVASIFIVLYSLYWAIETYEDKREAYCNANHDERSCWDVFHQSQLNCDQLAERLVHRADEGSYGEGRALIEVMKLKGCFSNVTA